MGGDSRTREFSCPGAFRWPGAGRLLWCVAFCCGFLAVSGNALGQPEVGGPEADPVAGEAESADGELPPEGPADEPEWTLEFSPEPPPELEVPEEPSSMSDENAELRGIVEDLKERVEELESDRDALSLGRLFTRTGDAFELGGKFDLLFIDTDAERDPVVGTTDERDPYLLIDVVRLSPRIRLNKDLRLRGQMDLKPANGRSRLKEATLRYRNRPVWWFRSSYKLGLDDRFIRIDRETKNYPMAGTAFWRDETVGVFSTFRFGDRSGPPLAEGQEAPHALDFASNLGEARLHLSLANIHRLDFNEVGFDEASFNSILQDDRNVFDDLAAEEVGLGFGYARDFRTAGEIDLLAFYYFNTLNSDSVDVLRDELTLRDGMGNPIAGYGDSERDDSYRLGFSGEYFFPAKTLFGNITKVRNNDGLDVKAQWIRGRDGEMRRESWFVQAGYRFSFPKRLLANRYFRSVEPLVRYGEFKTNISPDPNLPGTWDREAVLLGLITRVTRNLLLRIEYSIFDEETGGDGGAAGPTDVKNNELIANVIVRF